MTARLPHLPLIAATGLVLFLLRVPSGCVATPLPTPPSARVDRMTLVTSGEAAVTLSGSPGAVAPGAASIASLRVTGARAWTQVPLAVDGSFSATLPGEVTEVLALEAVLVERDVFLVAVVGTVGGGGPVAETDPGPDADGDGSPDVVDCAPADPALGGRRCEPECVAELCNGLDDDCDGVVDEDCADEWCGAGGVECGEGEVCVAGVCVQGGTDNDGDGFTASADCDDADAAVYPGAEEICNALDDDCDGEVDEACVGGCATDDDCDGGATCVDGVCSCPAGFELCELVCLDTSGDSLNCGGCGAACSAGQTCVDGACAP